jgi:hypothetical protein
VTCERIVKKLHEWKPISTRLAGTPKIIGENDIKDDLRHTKVNNWTKCIQIRVKCKEVVEKGKIVNQ